jgi:hypothetical protein
MTKPDKTYSPWSRRVTTEVGDGKLSVQMVVTEFLDMELVLKRFVDITHERGDASLRDRLHYALNGDG